jgi:hypothetical protein
MGKLGRIAPRKPEQRQNWGDAKEQNSTIQTPPFFPLELNFGGKKQTDSGYRKRKRVP